MSNEDTAQPVHLCSLDQILVFIVPTKKLSKMYPVKILIRPGSYKHFFMLISAEHDIFSANKYENANNSWHFHIY